MSAAWPAVRVRSWGVFGAKEPFRHSNSIERKVHVCWDPSKWKTLAIPAIPGVFKAASFPFGSVWLVWTDKGVFRLVMKEGRRVKLSGLFAPKTAEQRFDREKHLFVDRVTRTTHVMNGLVGPDQKIITHLPVNEKENVHGHSLETSEDRRTTTVRDAAGQVGMSVNAAASSTWMVPPPALQETLK